MGRIIGREHLDSNKLGVNVVTAIYLNFMIR